LDDLTAWCRQGPPSATVDQVETALTEATGEFRSFNVRY
jgi:acylphosphatase